MVELVLTFTFVPGAYCAVQVFRTGLALLRGVRAPLERVLARATTATVCLNVALLAFGVVAVTARLENFEWMIASMAYATVSLAHVAFVNWAYRRHARRYDAPEGSPVSFARPSPAVAA
jgi:hypothetical protein